MKQCFFAVDLGATSGRTILGTFTPEGLEMEDVNRKDFGSCKRRI